MRYRRSKPVEVEAMQWHAALDQDCEHQNGHTCAEQIVAWVNAHGGEARYDPENHTHPYDPRPYTPARIAVRTINGWAYAAPGHYIVKGSTEIQIPDWLGEEPHPLRDFYPCDPETFERRWEPVAGTPKETE